MILPNPSQSVIRAWMAGLFEMMSRKSRVDKEKISFTVHPTKALTLLNFIDMFSVALVVPLLNQYYKDAGVLSASLRELLGSLFSSSQILGSLLMGALSDSGILSRRKILYISFLGSALSYSLIVFGEFRSLLISRVIVGGVKQTFTISTSMISSYTTPGERTRHIGQLSSCSTGAFIVGPSVGSYLYKNIDKRAPAFLAASLFIMNFFLAVMLLPSESPYNNQKNRRNGNNVEKSNKFSNFFTNLKSCFASKDLGNVIIVMLVFNWLTRATSYVALASFYEKMYSIEPHQRGYLASYNSVLSFLFQTCFIQYFVEKVGGEYIAVCAATCALAFSTVLAMWSNLQIFLIFVCPIVAVANSVLRLSLRSLVTQIAQKDSLGSVLAALDILQNLVSVSVPFYRSVLFKILACFSNADYETDLGGDPAPIMWLKSSLIHWIVATMIIIYLFRDNVQKKEKIS